MGIELDELRPEDKPNPMKYVEKREIGVRSGGWWSKVKLERKEREALGAVC